MMQFFAVFLLLAVSAGALPQASNPATTLLPSSTPVDTTAVNSMAVNSTAATNIDKRGKDPVVGLFTDMNCAEKHIGDERPIPTACTQWKLDWKPQRFKISWHHGPGKVEFFQNDNCVREENFIGKLVRGDDGPEWECIGAWDFRNVASWKVPND